MAIPGSTPCPAVPLPAAGGLSFRPLAATDLDAWLALTLRIAAAEDAPWHDTRSELATCFEDTDNPAAGNTAGGFDAPGVLRAFGRVTKHPGGAAGYAFGGVDPQWQRRGIGAAVLAWQEDLLRARFAADGQPPGTVRVYTPEANPAHTSLLSGAGYSTVRYFSEMLRPLAGAPAVPVPAGIRIVAFAPGLSEAVRLAHNETFADHWGSESRSIQRWGFLLANEDFRPDWSAVALDAASGEVAGYQLSMYDPERFPKEGREEGYTEVLGVRRPWRHRGIAQALLSDAMARYKAAGMDHACLDVDTENPTGALGLYEKMGYRPLRRTLAWDKAL
ncbi:N-acetyltransferase [Arthrobacter sp. STN4]|uniref:GNAT family N-acetyltransferase n=1 Tax=Arthrobacter sp. STN4 TaxID=2923276 RepID=UPI00211A1898|nr:N-acetyltransferase [Arthrobacter sp. STN4]MCQ9164092.1 GNAT family N-acetyltransferase [Arthrobacter sp. STN4]